MHFERHRSGDDADDEPARQLSLQGHTGATNAQPAKAVQVKIGRTTKLKADETRARPRPLHSPVHCSLPCLFRMIFLAVLLITKWTIL